MVERIADFFNSRKGRDVLLVVSVVLLGAVSFGLGRLSVTSEPHGRPVTLYMPATTAGVVDESGEARVGEIDAVGTTGQYVASKNGSVYHLPWCSGAQRIKEENKVWFSSKEEAESQGLRPAANCKGL